MNLVWTLRAIGVLAMTVGLILTYMYIEHRGYERCQTEMQTANLKAMTAYMERLKKAEEERNENQNTIDRLVAESRRVRIHLPVCRDTTPSDQDRGARVLSDRVDKSFERLQARATELFKRCDELNLDAIKVNAVSK